MLSTSSQYVCRCNMCWNLYIDMNPDANAKAINVIAGSMQPLKRITDITGSTAPQTFWGCPKCATDEFLTDENTL